MNPSAFFTKTPPPATTPQDPLLHRLVNSFRFLGFLLWFVLGPGGLREAPGRPTDSPRIAQGPLPGAPGPPGPGSKNLKTNTLCRALVSGRANARTYRRPRCMYPHIGYTRVLGSTRVRPGPQLHRQQGGGSPPGGKALLNLHSGTLLILDSQVWDRFSVDFRPNLAPKPL